MSPALGMRNFSGSEPTSTSRHFVTTARPLPGARASATLVQLLARECEGQVVDMTRVATEHATSRRRA
jgi:hypothetical protein